MVEVEEWPDTFGDREGNVLMREGQEHTIDQVFSEDDSAPAYAKASAGS
jgi:hypothetical protein